MDVDLPTVVVAVVVAMMVDPNVNSSVFVRVVLDTDVRIVVNIVVSTGMVDEIMVVEAYKVVFLVYVVPALSSVSVMAFPDIVVVCVVVTAMIVVWTELSLPLIVVVEVAVIVAGGAVWVQGGPGPVVHIVVVITVAATMVWQGNAGTVVAVVVRAGMVVTQDRGIIVNIFICALPVIVTVRVRSRRPRD